MPYNAIPSEEIMRELEQRARLVGSEPPPPYQIPESTHMLLSQMQTLHKMRCKEAEDVVGAAKQMNARYESLVAEAEALMAAIERLTDWQRRTQDAAPDPSAQRYVTG